MRCDGESDGGWEMKDIFWEWGCWGGLQKERESYTKVLLMIKR